MKETQHEEKNLSTWQQVFAQSKVNGATYHGEKLQGQHWNWPKDTYLQRRLKQLKWQPLNGDAKLN